MVYELIYFPIRGRGEQIRILFEATGTAYKNTLVRYATPEFRALKAQLPFGQVPILRDTEDKSFELAQSNAILRFVAKQVNLLPKGQDAARLEDQADQYKEALQDMFVDFMSPSPNRIEPGAKRTEHINAFIANRLPARLAPFERQLLANGNKGILVGDELSYIDLNLFVFLEPLVDIDPEVFLKAKAPAVAKLFDTVRAQPRVSQYIASKDRAEAFFPFKME